MADPIDIDAGPSNRIVLNRVLLPHEDEGSQLFGKGAPYLVLAEDGWLSLGEPDTITIVVLPGDRLNRS